MKRHPFPVGALVVNTGRLRGQGYIWRVEGYEPLWESDGKHHSKTRFGVVCKNIGPLHGKPEPGDYHIGGRFLYDPATKELLGKTKPPHQMSLI